MQAFVLKKEIYLSTGTYSRYYPQTKSIAEAQTDQIFIDVSGEVDLLRRAFRKLAGLEIDDTSPDGQEVQDDDSSEVVLLKEEIVVNWEYGPARLGRISSKLFAQGMHWHEEDQALAHQLKALRLRAQGKKHFRFAVVNGFGSNLGDNMIGMAAFRNVLDILEAHFESFSVDILFGPEANRSAEHIVGHDPRVEQIFYQSISLVDFSRYDAYFDVSGLITLPRWNDLSAVDWYLWWFGVDPSQIPPASKRNKLFIPWFEWSTARDMLAGLKGLKILYKPKASVALRSIPADYSVRLAKALLDFCTDLYLIIDEPLSLVHDRLIDFSSRRGSVERFSAMLSQVDGVVTVDSFALHAADAASTPCVGLETVLPVDFYPHYPSVSLIGIENLDSLPAYRKSKVSKKHWEEIKTTYEDAWDRVNPKVIFDNLMSKIESAKLANDQKRQVFLVDKLPKKSFIAYSKEGIAKPLRLVWTEQDNLVQRKIFEIAKSVLKPGSSCVLVGAPESELVIDLAKLLCPLGNLNIFEPRQPFAQVHASNLIREGVMGSKILDFNPVDSASRGKFSDIDPWSELYPFEWGNARNQRNILSRSIDEYDFFQCNALIIQPPFDVIRVLNGALKTLERTRSLVVISKLHSTQSDGVNEVLSSIKYTLWMEADNAGMPLSTGILIAIPSERVGSVEGFVKVI